MIAAAPSTKRLYWDEADCFETDAIVVAQDQDRIACDRTCFYPGGGGQPADRGVVCLAGGVVLEILGAQADASAVIWHLTKPAPPAGIVGAPVRLTLDRERRVALARYHTVLHVLDTIALFEHGAWITGVQIGAEYSRIDFKLEQLSAALRVDLESKVNAVLMRDCRVTAHYIPESEFGTRQDLLRTLEAKPPIIDGQVRVVQIEGFDAQACGGTHVSRTSQVGRFSILRTENKGKINKRLYVQLKQ